VAVEDLLQGPADRGHLRLVQVPLLEHRRVAGRQEQPVPLAQRHA
jgi:hypothetical protein